MGSWEHPLSLFDSPTKILKFHIPHRTMPFKNFSATPAMVLKLGFGGWSLWPLNGCAIHYFIFVDWYLFLTFGKYSLTLIIIQFHHVFVGDVQLKIVGQEQDGTVLYTWVEASIFTQVISIISRNCQIRSL